MSKYHVICDCCGQEVWEGETLYEWDGEWICPDCFKDKVSEYSLDEIAKLIGSDTKVVANPRPWTWYSPEDHAEEEERLIENI